MKKLRIAVFVAAVGMLLTFLLLRLWYRERQPVDAADITFQIQAGEQDFRLKLWHNYYDGKEYLFLPSFCRSDAECIITAATSSRRSWDGEGLGLFGHLRELSDGEHVLHVGESEFFVVVMRSANVPALFLTTASGELTEIEAQKGNGEPGLYRMVSSEGKILEEGQMDELKSRGNATFLEDKKPYQMSLQESADLLGTGELENYILLANRQDQSLLRNRIMYDLAAEIGLPYSPVSQHLDLYINEEYRGSYQLSEKVEAAENRLPIDVSGMGSETGFLVSLEYQTEDRLTADECYFITENGQAVVINRPKNPSAAQEQFIQNTFQEMETAIRSGNLKQSNIDVASFAKKYLIEEIGKNLDAMYTSQYFYKDTEEETIYAGPVWDYDKTLGNPLIERNRPVNYQEPRGIFAATKQENASWWYDLYEIPAFREKVILEYENEAVPAIEKMLDAQIDDYAEEIWNSAYMDYMRWDTFEDFKYEEALAFEEEYGAEVEQIKNFLSLRRDFLNDIWLDGRIYNQITCNSDGGVMYVTQIDGVEGRTLNEPRNPKKEGYDFAYWIREDSGEIYDFTETYDGIPFTLKAVYAEEE